MNIKNTIKNLPYNTAKMLWRTFMFILRSITTLTIIYPLNALNTLTQHLDFRHKKDAIYCLIIFNIIIWSSAYAMAGSWLSDYRAFMTSETPKVIHSVKARTLATTTAMIKSVKTQTKVETRTEPFIVTTETIRTVTAYNTGDINQCSGNPCISANGENICEALELGYKRCAANFVPFGTMLEIEHYGICMVTDRLNSRYPNRVDIAMKLNEKQRALKFGKQNLRVSILK